MSWAETQVDIGSLIRRTPGIKNGSPHIAGTGVLVRSIVAMYKQGLIPEEIVAEYGHLSLAQVHAALAYYHANPKSVEDELAAQAEAAKQLERKSTRGESRR